MRSTEKGAGTDTDIASLAVARSAKAQDDACAWIARLASDNAEASDHQAFALWLDERPEHRDAMDQMEAMWADLDVLKLHADYQVARPDQQPTNFARRRWLGGALAAAASLLVAFLLIPQYDSGAGAQQYQTRRGEQKLVSLPDGSRLQLNTATAITVEYRRDLRHISLTKGEAFFSVARDEQRPFVVTAGNTEVRALGTAFAVHLYGDISEVTVTEGVVRVSESEPPATRPGLTELLYPEQRVSAKDGVLGDVDAVKTAQLLAWREGKLIAEALPLSALVKELARYHATTIFIADPSIASTPVSGVFQLRDLDSILLALEHTVAVRSVTISDGSIELISAPL